MHMPCHAHAWSHGRKMYKIRYGPKRRLGYRYKLLCATQLRASVLKRLYPETPIPKTTLIQPTTCSHLQSVSCQSYHQASQYTRIPF